MKLTLQLVVDVVNTQFTIIICSAVVVFNTLIFCLLISSNSFKKLFVGKQIKVSLSEMCPGNTKYMKRSMKLTLLLVVVVVLNAQFAIIICSAVVVFNTFRFCLFNFPIFI